MVFQSTDGFCVHKNVGRLVFRVNNCLRAGELLLMDGQGMLLLFIRPQPTGEWWLLLGLLTSSASSSVTTNCMYLLILLSQC
jgi:hypothetical protein